MHKLEGMIGLCVKAGKAVFGSESCVSLVRKRQLPLVILAEDASDRTKKLIFDKCHSFHGKWILYGTVDSLGRITGKHRVAAIGIRDEGFSTAILKIYGGGANGENSETK